MTQEISTQIAEYSVTTAELAKLKARFDGAKYDVSTTAGLDMAKKDRRELVALRTALESKRAEIKAPALAQCNLIDSEAKRIKAEIVALEAPIDAIIKQEEARKEAEKAEKARLAAEAQKVLDDKILEIGKLPLRCIGKDSGEIALFLAALEAKEIGGEFTGETRTRAEQAKADAVAEIRVIHAQLVEQEEKAAAIKAEQEKETARLEAERGEREAQEAAQREALAAQQAELDEQKRLNDIEAARLSELAKAAKQAEEEAAAELKRQQDALDAERREKEKQDAIEAEQKRIAAEKEKKAAEKARKLAESKFKDVSTALQAIQDICDDDRVSDSEARAKIAVIAEANL